MNRRMSGMAPRLVLGTLAAALIWPSLEGTAQNETRTAARHKDLAAEIRELHAKVAKLEAALKRGHPGMASAPSGRSAMAGMMGGQQMGKGMSGTAGREDRGAMSVKDDKMDLIGMMDLGGRKVAGRRQARVDQCFLCHETTA